MAFPVPGDAIEPYLDLNQHLIDSPASTFFFRVDGALHRGQEVQPGDLLVVNRALEAEHHSLVIGAISGELVVSRVQCQAGKLVPILCTDSNLDLSLAIWGVVTVIIRKVGECYNVWSN